MFWFWSIPKLVARPWRLCRELDEYGDAECAAFTQAAKAWRAAGLALAFPMTMIVGVALAIFAYDLAPARFRSEPTPVERALYAVGLAVIVAVTLTLAFAPYVFIIRWALKRQISRAACPSCRYSLLGLPTVDGATTCPECGTTFVLAEHGLRVEDLLSEKRSPLATLVDSNRRPEHQYWNIALIAWLLGCTAVGVGTGSPISIIAAGLGVIVLLLFRYDWRSGSP